MSESERVDIMLPFYGREDHFREAVASVLAQDSDRWRLVVIDDAYPDRAPFDWAASVTDSRVKVIRHEVNLGINRSFQECLERSSAKWVTIFGCDDLMHPRYVTRILELAERYPHAGLLHPGTEIIDAEGRPTRSLVDTAKAFYRPRGPKPLQLSGEDMAVSLTRGNWMNFPAIAWNGELARRIGFSPGYDVVQDLALALDVCEQGGSLVLDDDVVFSYRRHATSVSSWKAVDGSRFVEESAYFGHLADHFRASGWRRAARAARRHLSSRINALATVPAALMGRDTRGAGVLLRHALRP
ncbi:MAG: glycosyl transferase family 2 [Henriciella sp.]|jgi:glycosyltransferase involved in cell wall biosynthesis|nr:glycosyl transferase family 2 [Henriciella sp.]|tara:strand:+ start:3126 stop:4022 length:897 start_codon:yes stop_codon:yes gene_type:complete